MVRLVWPLILAWLTSIAPDARVHVVAQGDSLSEIAERYRVRVEDLRAWNRIDGDRIRIGQELALEAPGGSRTVHRVVPGDTIGRIARRHGVTLARIAALNPGIDAGRLRLGASIVIGEGVGSESRGQPGAGTIEGALRLPEHPGYVIRDRERAYATERTIARLRAGFDAVRRAEPRAPRARVHDLSLRGGGPIDDHHTHQSGRDVDITYFQRSGCRADGCPLRPIAPAELDVRAQWRLLHHWLSRGEIEVIYVDRALQAPLWREARRRGATREELAAWFQYPRSIDSDAGLIRHYPNHANHVHVRFACHASERRCEPSRDGP